MRIAHISDLHLTENGRIIWDVDTQYHFTRLLDKLTHINGLEAIIITGDISDDGSQCTYEYLDNAIGRLGIPTFCLPGNHDSLSMFYKQYSPRFYSISRKENLLGWKFLFLNSVWPDEHEPCRNKSRGLIPEEDLQFIDRELTDGMPTCICLHHPPIEPGGWLNRKLLENRMNFNQLLERHANAKCVLFGHIHYYTQIRIGGTLFCSAPSVGFAFDKDLPKFQIADGDEGFSIVELENEIKVQRLYL